jgi:Xaa-Pro dipeptidase
MNTKRFHEILREHDLDAFLVSSGENVFYTSGFQTMPSVGNKGIFNQTRLQNAIYAIMPRGGDPTLIVSFGFYGVAKAQSRIKDIRCSGTTMYVDRSQKQPEVQVYAASPIEGAIRVIQEKGLEKARIAWEVTMMPEHVSAAFRNGLPQVKWVDGKEILLYIKMIKTPEEIDIIREATQANVYAIKKMYDGIREGVTEKGLLDTYKRALREKDCDWGTTTLGAGGNSGEPYNIAGDYKLKRGDAIRFDLCPTCKGYFSDLARCMAVGDLPADHKKLYNTVHGAEARMVEIIRPGVKMKELFKIGMETVQKHYPGFKRPNLGHNLGVFVHEEPDIGPNEVILEPGMILAVEVPYYVPGVIGVNVENDVLVTEQGYEIFDADLPTTLIVR